MLDFKVYSHEAEIDKERFIDFLHKHLGKYRDEKSEIEKAIDYAVNENEGMGGFVVGGFLGDELIGCVVINDTAMEGYIPQHMLVYIAVHEDYRGKGYGKQLMNRAVELCSGNIALHVEYDNPARFLYRRLGFKNKYAEMRYEQKDDSERQKEMEKRILKRYKKHPEEVQSTLDWITKLDHDDLGKMQDDFKEYLNELVLWVTDWDDIFEDRDNWLTKFVSSFSTLISLPYEQQYLLNRIQKEFYHAIERAIESDEWDFAWDEFVLLIKAANEVQKKLDDK